MDISDRALSDVSAINFRARLNGAGRYFGVDWECEETAAGFTTVTGTVPLTVTTVEVGDATTVDFVSVRLLASSSVVVMFTVNDRSHGRRG